MFPTRCIFSSFSNTNETCTHVYRLEFEISLHLYWKKELSRGSLQKEKKNTITSLLGKKTPNREMISYEPERQLFVVTFASCTFFRLSATHWQGVNTKTPVRHVSLSLSLSLFSLQIFSNKKEREKRKNPRQYVLANLNRHSDCWV